MKNSTAILIKETEDGQRLIKYNNRYYTVFGRMFAVRGNHLNDSYEIVRKLKRYSFLDFNTLSGMFIQK